MKSAFELSKKKRNSTIKVSKFVDQIQVIIRAGKGGDGGVAFHREKFVARGGPSGGNGGQGGSVYIRPTKQLHSLNRISKVLRAESGHNGSGEWMNGQGGKDLIVHVPIGTVLKEIRCDQISNVSSNLKSSPTPKSINFDEENAEVAKLRRSKLFVHYPESEDSNQSNQVLKQVEANLIQEQREIEKARIKSKPIEIDCTKVYQEKKDEIKIKKMGKIDQECILIAKGGEGGLGNSNFSGNQTTLPRFATRGKDGQEFRFELELKTLADIGLVGFPNSGKSTLIHALTNSRAEVAPYPFTTLHPQIGTLIIFNDGTWDVDETARPIQDSASPTEYLNPQSATDLIRDRTNRDSGDHHNYEEHSLRKTERIRLTIADCPGLLPKASQNFGLGHDFLRHIERSKMLILVIDLMAGLSFSQSSSSSNTTTFDSLKFQNKRQDDDDDPLRCCRDVQTLLKELEAYQVGLSNRVGILVANKADLSSSFNDAKNHDSKLEAIAKIRLQALKDFMKSFSDFKNQNHDANLKPITVLATSAKFRLNIKKLVDSISNFFLS